MSLLTCAEWRARYAALAAAELAALTGAATTMIQYGEKRVQRSEIDLRALREAKREAKIHVNKCDGCGSPMLIETIPSDC